MPKPKRWRMYNTESAITADVISSWAKNLKIIRELSLPVLNLQREFIIPKRFQHLRFFRRGRDIAFAAQVVFNKSSRFKIYPLLGINPRCLIIC